MHATPERLVPSKLPSRQFRSHWGVADDKPTVKHQEPFQIHDITSS